MTMATALFALVISATGNVALAQSRDDVTLENDWTSHWDRDGSGERALTFAGTLYADFDCSGQSEEVVVSSNSSGDLVFEVAFNVPATSTAFPIDPALSLTVLDMDGDNCDDLAVTGALQSFGLVGADWERFVADDGGADGDYEPDTTVTYTAATGSVTGSPISCFPTGLNCREVNECVYFGQIATIECGPGIRCPVPLCTRYRWVCDPI